MEGRGFTIYGRNQSIAKKIMKIAALALAMTTIFMLSPFVAALGHENSRHREERSDLQLFFA